MKSYFEKESGDLNTLFWISQYFLTLACSGRTPPIQLVVAAAPADHRGTRSRGGPVSFTTTIHRHYHHHARHRRMLDTRPIHPRTRHHQCGHIGATLATGTGGSRATALSIARYHRVWVIAQHRAALVYRRLRHSGVMRSSEGCLSVTCLPPPHRRARHSRHVLEDLFRLIGAESDTSYRGSHCGNELGLVVELGSGHSSGSCVGQPWVSDGSVVGQWWAKSGSFSGRGTDWTRIICGSRCVTQR